MTTPHDLTKTTLNIKRHPMKDIDFHPMTIFPHADEANATISKTVLIYGDGRDLIELGYYDFAQNSWSHFGKNTFLLKCWCYVPLPEVGEDSQWTAYTPKGYRIL